jgi:hypothetical protein
LLIVYFLDILLPINALFYHMPSEKILLALLPSVSVTKDEVPPPGGATVDRLASTDIHPTTLANHEGIFPPPIITRTAATPMASPPTSPARVDGVGCGNRAKLTESRCRNTLAIDRLAAQSQNPVARVHVREKKFIGLQ